MAPNNFTNSITSDYTLSDNLAKNQVIVKTCPSGDYESADKCTTYEGWK